MRIQNCKIKNYKVFEDVEIALEGKSAVIFGANGMGKSTLINAIDKVMYTWVKRINQKQAKYVFSNDEVRHNSESCCLEVDVSMNDDCFKLSRQYDTSSIEGQKGNETRSEKSYRKFIDSYTEKYVISEKKIPLFLSYGTNRTATEVSVNPNPKSEFYVISALERAIESKIDFNTFFEWFRAREDYENEVKITENDMGYSDEMLNCIKTAIQSMLDNVTDLRIKRSPLAMVVTKNGQDVKVDQLSDGEKCTLALFGDIARRLAVANQNTENPLEGDGIILIDEIELHMHPSWQRKVLGVLSKTFPNIQFIVTTHSPQVLGETTDDYAVIVLECEDNAVSVREIGRMDVLDSNTILEDYMGTVSKNTNIIEKISNINHLIGEKEFDEAQNAISELINISDMNNPDVIQLTAYLKRMRWLDEKN